MIKYIIPHIFIMKHGHGGYGEFKEKWTWYVNWNSAFNTTLIV